MELFVCRPRVDVKSTSSGQMCAVHSTMSTILSSLQVLHLNTASTVLSSNHSMKSVGSERLIDVLILPFHISIDKYCYGLLAYR